MQTIFITGGTGYIGSRLIAALLQTGNYRIKALARKGSEHKLPPSCEVVIGDALDASTYSTYTGAPQNRRIYSPDRRASPLTC